MARPLGPTIKQHVRLQGVICPEKCQIQNGRLVAFIAFNMRSIYNARQLK